MRAQGGVSAAPGIGSGKSDVQSPVPDITRASQPGPTFFVIGAAKSGTTSLHDYLAQHPRVFMSRVKEPNYFAFMDGLPHYAGPDALSESPFLRDRLRREKYGYSILTEPEYRAIFAGARPGMAIGESSVSYMYYSEVAHRIRERVPDARFIAVLRHPVDRAYSKYMQFRRDGSEPLEDFEAAVAAEPERIRQRWSPTWYYLDRGYYHRQLSVYFDLFGRERIHIALYEDFVRDPAGTLDAMFRFLGVGPYCVDMSNRHNVSSDARVPRLRVAYDLMMRPNPLANTLRRVVPDAAVRAVRPLLRRALLKQAPPATHTRMTPELRARLTRCFVADIEALQRLIDRDLSSWL